MLPAYSASNRFNALQTATLVRAEGMITQLIFEHALRLRVKSETTSTPAPSVAPTPDTASLAGSDTDTAVGDSSESAASHAGEASSSTAVSSGSQTSGKDASQGGDKKGGAEKDDKEKKGDNFVGKINNLVTTDLQSIVSGRDFTMVVVFMPVMTAISLYFLYLVLGWRCDLPFSPPLPLSMQLRGLLICFPLSNP